MVIPREFSARCARLGHDFNHAVGAGAGQHPPVVRSEHAVDLLEAAYWMAGDTQSWLDRLALAAKPLSQRHIGTGARLIRHAAGAVNMMTGSSSPFDDFRTTTADSDHYAFYESEHRRKLLGLLGTPHSFTSSEMFEGLDGVLKQLSFPAEMRDALHIGGPGEEGSALVISVILPSKQRLSPASRSLWQRVGVHLGAALRLRLALSEVDQPQRGADQAAGVIDPRTGRLLDCPAGDPGPDARQALRRAASDVDRARTKAVRSDGPAALALWRGLFDGRWSVVDTFDSDGRRLLVAHENAPNVAHDRRLTRREQQVVASIGQGTKESITAYSLGLSVSTVRTHLRRALNKLQLERASQLVEIAAQLRGGQ